MSTEHIAVVRLRALGDVVLTLPLLAALRRHRPAARITFVTGAAYAPLFATQPEVDDVVAVPPNEGMGYVAQRLRSHGVTFLADLQGNRRSAELRWRLRVPTGRYGKRRWRRWWAIWTGRLDPHPVPVAARYLDAVRALTGPMEPEPTPLVLDPDAATTALAIAPPPYVVLAPGAAHATKRWPAPHWQTLARALRADGHRVVGLGLASERVLDDTDACSAFGVPLRTAAALCAGARAVVANDSGLLHVAAATGTPVVGLYGPTTPRSGFAPFGVSHRVVERQLACRPCSSFGGPVCPAGHHRCLRDLHPDRVLDATRSLL